MQKVEAGGGEGKGSASFDKIEPCGAATREERHVSVVALSTYIPTCTYCTSYGEHHPVQVHRNRYEDQAVAKSSM
jgi:hypothetical protein